MTRTRVAILLGLFLIVNMLVLFIQPDGQISTAQANTTAPPTDLFSLDPGPRTYHENGTPPHFAIGPVLTFALTGEPAITPARPAAGPLQNIIAIAANLHHTCALTSGGGVKCWGNNSSGQLGDGTTIQRLTPVDVSGLNSGISAIAVGGLHTCALTDGGGVKCWGWNFDGQLGDGTTTDRLTPVDVSSLSSGVTAIAASGAYTCALTSEGGVKCWGSNGYGQLGDGTTTDRLTPVDVSGLGSGVSAIAVGRFHACVLTGGGDAKCWGQNNGRLGDGTTIQRLTPVDVSGMSSGVTAITAGMDHTCALTNEGGARCWGSNAIGQVGDGTTTHRLTPVDVSGLGNGVSAIAASAWQHTCALTSGGGVKCWGSNSYGQLGDGTAIQRLTPVDVSGMSSEISAIAAGGNHTCALTSGGRVKCWGYNDYGQLGDNTTTNHLTPVDVVEEETYSISGQITDANNNPISEVTVSTPSGYNASTDATGTFNITNLTSGLYEIVASKDGYVFWPPKRRVSVSSNSVGQDFTEWVCALDVPMYFQGDPYTPPPPPIPTPTWHNQIYDDYPDTAKAETLGKWGCNISSIAMVTSYFGKTSHPPFETDPGDLDTGLKVLDGYDYHIPDYADVLRYAWDHKVELFLDGFWANPAFLPNNQRLDMHLCSGNPAVLKVRQPASASGVHFVVATGKVTLNGQSTYTLNDPILGQTVLSRSPYNNNYLSAYYYALGIFIRRSMLEISAHSPVHLLIVDPLGHRLGYDPRTNTWWDEIPDAGYETGSIASSDGSTLPEMKTLLVPHPIDGQYNVQVIGYDRGSYEIIVHKSDISGNISQERFLGEAQKDSVDNYTIEFITNKVYLPIILHRN